MRHTKGRVIVVRRNVNIFIPKGVKGVAKDLIPACILLFVSCFMLLIFEPILLYATNMNDLWFDFQIMIWPVLSIFFISFLTGIIIICALYCADLLLTGRLVLYKGIILTGFVIFFLLYLQGNWLIGNLPVLTGERIVWENYGKYESIILILAMILLISAMIISIKKKELDQTVFYAAICTSVVFVMLFTALIPTIVTNGALDSKKNTFAPALRNFNTISSNKNFLIFLVDAADSQTYYEVMMGDDDFRGMMEDFTYYPDTLSVFPYTINSMPNILTGTVNHNETNFRNYISNAYNQSTLFEKLTQNGYEINLYNPVIPWEGERAYTIENAAPTSDISIDYFVFMKEEAKYVLFKYLPFGMKQLSNIGTFDFEHCKIVKLENGGYSSYNPEVYKNITENSVLDKQSNNYFQFVYCDGSHVPYDMDKNLNTVTDGTYAQKVAASLTMIKAYLQRLKDNDAYDNSVIVIMSDHGSENTGVTYEDPEGQYILGRFNPILFIKGVHEKHEMLRSDRCVSYMDLQDAFCDLIEGKQSTELFAELEPGRVRTVLWHFSWQEYFLVEYSTTGTASETEKFTPTGVIYELKG